MEFFLCVIGMVFVVEGLPYFGFPQTMKAMMQFMHEQNETSLRIMGASMIGLGLVILFLARRFLGTQ